MLGRLLRNMLGLGGASEPVAQATPARQVPSSLQGTTRDNQITNRLVYQGRLPRSQAEVFPQRSSLSVNSTTPRWATPDITGTTYRTLNPMGFTPGYVQESYPGGQLQQERQNYYPQLSDHFGLRVR